MNSKDRIEKTVLPLEQAVHNAVRKYPGGVGAVAGTFGWKSPTLQNKTNPTQHHNLTLSELEDILSLTRSPLILDSIARATNTAWFDLGQFKSTGDMAVLDTITNLVSKVGKLSKHVQESLDDGEVDDDELAMLEKDVMHLAAAAQSVLEIAKQFQKK